MTFVAAQLHNTIKPVVILSMRLLFFIASLSLCLTASAAVYKSVQPDGSVIYTNQPPQPGSKAIELTPLQSIKSVSPASTQAEPVPTKSAQENYSQLEITDPSNDETIRENTGHIVVEFNLDPPLRTEEGHTITITMDGQSIASGVTSTPITLDDVPRGTHSLGVQVVGKDGAPIINAKPVTFHLLRASILQRQNTRP